MATIVVLAAIPLMILNMLGGIVGFVALAVQGEWGAICGGLAWCLIGAFVLSIAMLPAMIFAPLSVWAANRGYTSAAVIAALPSIAWTYIVLAVSSLTVFHAVISRPDAGFFHLLWAYCVTTAPWSYLANKDKQAGNETSSMLMFFVQLGTVSMMVGSWTDPSDMPISDLAIWFLPFMAIGILVQLLSIWLDLRNTRSHAL